MLTEQDFKRIEEEDRDVEIDDLFILPGRILLREVVKLSENEYVPEYIRKQAIEIVSKAKKGIDPWGINVDISDYKLIPENNLVYYTMDIYENTGKIARGSIDDPYLSIDWYSVAERLKHGTFIEVELLGKTFFIDINQKIHSKINN